MSAAAAEEKSESASSSSGSSGGGSSKIVLILTGVNVVATIAMIAILFVSFQKDKKTPAVEDIAAHSATEGHEAKKEGEEHGGGHGEKAEHGKAEEKKKTAD